MKNLFRRAKEKIEENVDLEKLGKKAKEVVGDVEEKTKSQRKWAEDKFNDLLKKDPPRK
jgi:hypothetical protein